MPAFRRRTTKKNLAFMRTQESSRFGAGIPVLGEIPAATDWFAVSLFRLDDDLLLGQRVEHPLAGLQMLIDQQVRRVCEPLGERNVFVERALEHLEEDEVGVAGVFDPVGNGLLNVANVAL